MRLIYTIASLCYLFIRLNLQVELAYIDHGGILPYVIRILIKQWYFVFPFLVRLLRYTRACMDTCMCDTVMYGTQ